MNGNKEALLQRLIIGLRHEAFWKMKINNTKNYNSHLNIPLLVVMQYILIAVHEAILLQ